MMRMDEIVFGTDNYHKKDSKDDDKEDRHRDDRENRKREYPKSKAWDERDWKQRDWKERGDWKQGDWKCKQCGYMVFATKTTCPKCEKPGSEKDPKRKKTELVAARGQDEEIGLIIARYGEDVMASYLTDETLSSELYRRLKASQPQ